MGSEIVRYHSRVFLKIIIGSNHADFSRKNNSSQEQKVTAAYVLGTEGFTTSSSSSELLTTFRSLLAPFGGLLTFGVREGAGSEGTGFKFDFGALLRQFSINESVEISKSSPDLGLKFFPPQELYRCKRHRKEPA